MMDPLSALSIFAEVSVALAGFSGIIVSFGQRTRLSNVDKRRLANLFAQSGMVLSLSLVGMSVLFADFDLSIIWRGGSLLVFLFFAPWLVLDILKVKQLSRDEKTQMSMPVFYLFDSFVVALLVLQLFNVVTIAQPWPFFLALTLATIGAFQQFILLITTRPAS